MFFRKTDEIKTHYRLYIYILFKYIYRFKQTTQILSCNFYLNIFHHKHKLVFKRNYFSLSSEWSDISFTMKGNIVFFF